MIQSMWTLGIWRWKYIQLERMKHILKILFKGNWAFGWSKPGLNSTSLTASVWACYSFWDYHRLQQQSFLIIILIEWGGRVRAEQLKWNYFLKASNFLFVIEKLFFLVTSRWSRGHADTMAQLKSNCPS